MSTTRRVNVDPENARHLDEWDGPNGTFWAEQADSYDASVTRHQAVLLAAIAAQGGERILDVGCGSGRLAIDIVRGVPRCSAVGIDLSSAQLAVARKRSGDLPVRFEQVDAQVHDFGEATFDVVVSRFGTMFFADPVAAFANLARSTKPGGRLVMMVWRRFEENEWLREILGAIGKVRPAAPPPPDVPGPFALGDPERVRSVLSDAGWSAVETAPIEELMWFGSDADAATQFVRGQMSWRFNDLNRKDQQRAEQYLHDVMTAHQTAGGVLFRSGTWLVTARR